MREGCGKKDEKRGAKQVGDRERGNRWVKKNRWATEKFSSET